MSDVSLSSLTEYEAQSFAPPQNGEPSIAGTENIKEQIMGIDSRAFVQLERVIFDATDAMGRARTSKLTAFLNVIHMAGFALVPIEPVAPGDLSSASNEEFTPGLFEEK